MSSSKRKEPPSRNEPSHKKQRVKMNHARVIATQTSGKAFGNGEIDVDKFVRAREFEIKALENGIKRSRKSLSSRAFQDVPRELRRRTASHNVKRVPKRLRPRATREMAEDNTPTVSSKTRKPTSHMRLRLDTAMRLKKLRSKPRKPRAVSSGGEASTDHRNKLLGWDEPKSTVKRYKLQKPLVPRSKFRKRQIHKAWLPTHLFHAKRAHMTPPKEPLWRMAIPLSPTAKSYRPTHRASSLRGAIAWDMSYMSTIGLDGPIKSLMNLFKALGVGADAGETFWEKQAKRWIGGTRIWQGWLYERNGWPSKAIAPATIIWQKKEEPKREQLSKSAMKKVEHDYRKVFVRVHPSAFRQIWYEVLNLCKVQKPAITAEDLRFEIGSIDIIGPAATEVLVGTLRPVAEDTTEDDPAKAWSSLATIPNPSSLPANALLGLDITDPRLHHPPKALQLSTDPNQHQRLLNVLATWPIDRTQAAPGLFDRTARYTASRQLPSQKAINRRRALAKPGEYPAPVESDPRIPVIMFVSKTGTGNQGSWTVMMPWKCILTTWYSLMYYPLSTGGTARFGGLDQKRQIAFESLTPWFPGDYPGTKAGMDWELQEREKRKTKWEAKPKGKRIEWASVDLGDDQKGELGLGWACDWDQLFDNSGVTPTEAIAIQQVPKSVAASALSRDANETSASASPGNLVTVSISLVGRGVPTACARIYRLPNDHEELHEEWIARLPQQQGKLLSQSKLALQIPKDAPTHKRRRLLAVALLDGSPANSHKTEQHLRMPSRKDLIGFVTTGNFNLGEGKATAIGCISLGKILELTKPDMKRHRQLCIVRESGQSMGRLARWELA